MQIDANAFSSSASTARVFILQSFDLGILDYSFLKGFNLLTNILINKCINPPTIGVPPKNFPNLPSLISILIDGDIYNNPCSNAALLAPCVCGATAGSKAVSITCPTGATIAQIQNAFNALPANTQIGNVLLNLPAGAINIPANFLGSIAADAISLIGSSGNTLSRITVRIFC